MAAVFCTQCGQRNPAGARFCARCGTALATIESAPRDDRTITLRVPDRLQAKEPIEIQADLADVEPGTGILVVVSGPTTGLEVPLVAPVTRLGRHPSSDVFLDDVTVSRRHVEIVRDGSGYVARDLGSLNGTYVNRRRVEEVVLKPGDELQVGKFHLVFLIA